MKIILKKRIDYMKMKKIFKSILKLAIFGSAAILIYSWGKDDGYDCGFKDGYRAADENMAHCFESEGNAVMPSKKVKDDDLETV